MTTIINDAKNIMKRFGIENVKIQEFGTLAEIAYNLTAYERYGEIDTQAYIIDTMQEILSIEEMLSYYNDFLDEEGYSDGHIYDMYDFEEITQGLEPLDLASRVYYGDFNPHREFFKFDGYANLLSFDGWEIDRHINNKDEFVLWYAANHYGLETFNNYLDDILKIAYELIKLGY